MRVGSNSNASTNIKHMLARNVTHVRPHVRHVRHVRHVILGMLGMLGLEFRLVVWVVSSQVFVLAGV